LPALARQASTAPTRPALSADDYTRLADELRTAYSKPQDQWPAPTVDAGVKFVEIGPLPKVQHPADNPYSKAKAALGKMLFFDARLSGSGQMACASCHDPDLDWTDGRTIAFGNARRQLERNTPSLLNVGHGRSFFWDGRAGSLEEQARMPILAEDEMHGASEVVVKRIEREQEYRKQFATVFGDETVSLDRIAQALATFERTIVGGRSKFDTFVSGKNPNALCDSAIRGLHLFRTAARCINCHGGPNFTDDQFHNIGLSYYGRKHEDLGRYHLTKAPEDVGAFKTPSLRSIARTAPYMHNGLFDLKGVLNMYDAGMPTLRRRADQHADPLFPTKSPLLHPLNLNEQDLADLTAFLDSLSEPLKRIRPPDSLPPATRRGDD
jgi:cytochrome c peroxidase